MQQKTITNKVWLLNHVVTRQRDLGWCLKFFFLWMRTIGINPVTQNLSLTCQILTSFIRYGLWIVFVIVNVIQLVFLFQPDTIKSNSLTYFWNYLIDSSNWMVHNLGVHSWVLFAALGDRNWAKLHFQLTEMHSNSTEKSNLILTSFERRLERLTIAGIFYIVLSVRKKTKIVHLVGYCTSISNW